MYGKKRKYTWHLCILVIYVACVVIYICRAEAKEGKKIDQNYADGFVVGIDGHQEHQGDDTWEVVSMPTVKPPSYIGHVATFGACPCANGT